MSAIHNLMTNPVPVSIAGWAAFGGACTRMTNDQRSIYIQNPVGGKSSGIEYALPLLGVGDYVYGFHASCPDHANGDQLSLIKSASDAKYLCTVRRTHPYGFYTGSFALASTGCKILFVAPEAQNWNMSVCDFIMAPASEWPVIQALYDIGGISDPYFYGESLPYA